MRCAVQCCVLILGAMVIGGALRLPRLAQRPMHGDEAVHADKFKDLLERRWYHYDPHEYHGPTLNYLTLPSAWLRSQRQYAQVDEVTLRIVPAIFGLVLIGLVWFLREGLGTRGSGWGAILVAISPAMVFYSRYYIQEMLLVCFSFGLLVCGYQYWRRRRVGWALGAGVFLGLTHATKETCIIVFAAMAAALVVVAAVQRGGLGAVRDGLWQLVGWHLAVGIAAAVVVSGLFYSSFLSHPSGVIDSVRTYATYFGRAGGENLHRHRWYYYLKMLLWFRYGGGPVWTEGVIVLLAVVGLVAAIRGRVPAGGDIALVRFVGLYTVVLTAVYSAIPYKTPWCLLGFLHGMILLAGVGVSVLMEAAGRRLGRWVVMVVLAAGCGHLLWQAYQANYRYYADSRNPYVYAHPTEEVFEVARRVKAYASVHEAGKLMKINVICADNDYWPLPWYLREFPNVGWFDHVPEDVVSASVIIASPRFEGELARQLYERTSFEQRRMYVFLFDRPYYIWLRPKVKLTGYVRKELYEQLWAPCVPAEVKGGRRE